MTGAPAAPPSRGKGDASRASRRGSHYSGRAKAEGVSVSPRRGCPPLPRLRRVLSSSESNGERKLGGPAASAKAPAAMPSRGHVNPRRGHQRELAAGVGPRAKCKEVGIR
jgi:hypothetical protein